MGWTPAQENAIKARGGSVLVSAAAGSGKTSVLVERIVQRIISKDNPCDVDELLVVTFAKDAAAEMKERIYKSLREMLEKEPNNERLIRQQLILPRAKICTIDSFFGEIVRNNASALGVSSEYRTVTGVEYEAYVMQAIALALDELYSANPMPEGFAELVELVSGGRNDKELEKTIKKIYESISAYPFPLRKLDEFVEMYRDTTDVKDSVWGAALLSYGRSALEYALARVNDLISKTRAEGELFKDYTAALETEKAWFDDILYAIDNLSWDEIVERVKKVGFSRLPEAGISRHPVKTAGTKVRNDYKAAFEKVQDSFFITSADIEAHRLRCLPIVTALSGAIKVFTEKLSEIMAEDNVLSFNDIQHLAVKALYDADGNRTEIACEMATRFKEILIDEYQDVNEVQHRIFSAISDNDSNIFRVGDVKQSIYGFRQAMPEIFLKMRDGFSKYSSGKYPAKIILGNNFRSGPAVVDTVNFCFGLLMSEAVGGIAYGEEDELVNEIKPNTARQSEFDIVVIPDEEKSDRAQAEFIADKIKSIMASGQGVTDKNGNSRPVRYGDFTILLRTAKRHADRYVDVLRSRGINVIYELSGDFFDCEEILVMMSLLRVIDNPLLDVELLSIMLSPLYGFTLDEVAAIRSRSKNRSLYSNVTYAARDDDHCARLISDISRYRLLASTVTSDALIRRIYDDTSFEAICRAMGDGEQRTSNLMLLLKYAQDFEANGFKGLSAFVRFMDKLEDSEEKMESSVDSSSIDNAVRIMTIHKSKGLEFPYCFVAGLDIKFNRMPINSGIITHSSLGIGLDLRNVDTLREDKTMHRAAVRRAIIADDIAEQMRVLYVAMTRAREKLIMVMGATDPDDLITRYKGVRFDKKIDASTGEVIGEALNKYSVLTAASPAAMALPCFLSDPEGGMVNYYENAFEMDEDNKGTPKSFSVNVIGVVTAREDDEDDGDNVEEIVIPPELEQEIEARLNYEYEYMLLSKTVSKTTASSLKARAFNKDFFATEIPAFMAKSGMTAAQRGTAAHRFLECCDYSRCSDLEAEAARLVHEGMLTQEQVDAIDLKLLKSFFESKLFERLMKSDNVNREYNFAVNISACELYPELPPKFADELIMVQGAVDCFFEEDGEIVIIDYKTDRVKDVQELVDRYTEQLKLYRSAIEQITEKKVKQCVLYSISLGKTVEI